MEAYVHLASQGLMLEIPAPMVDTLEPEPPPIIEVRRTADPGPRTVMDAMGYWLDRAFDTG
jgi:hypothetical protein